MSSSGSGGFSWHVTALSVLAGVGAGYFIGLLTVRWMWRDRRQPPQPPRPRPDLVGTLTDLTAEVGNLRTVISDILIQLDRQGRQPHFDETRRRSSESDTPYYEFEDEEEPVAHLDTDHLDELGKTTLESEEACHSLIAELEHRLEASPDDVSLLWRLARCLIHLSMHCDQKGRAEEEKQLLVKAVEHAQRALELDNTVWQSHQWYAIALGSQVKHEGVQKKITAGHQYREHIDIAISINPDSADLYHLRGRWCYEVAGLSWLEKKAAGALYATPPEATYDEALGDFMKVEELRPDTWKANLLYVGKCHIKMGDTPSGLEWLRKAELVSVVTTEDRMMQKELDELMATHESFS